MTNGLGRGLGSLIPQKNNQKDDTGGEIAVQTGDGVHDKILQIPPESIKNNPFQPREKFADEDMDELVNSIREYGIIQPLIVTSVSGGYELIAGERRLRAAKKLGLEKIPVIVRDAESHEKLEVALIENIQRENLNPIETARGYEKLMNEFNLNHEAMSKKLGKPRSSISNTLRLLKLPEEIKLALIEEKISEGHAKFLLGFDSEEKQMSLFRKILRSNLSVHDTNREAKRMGGTKKARIKINYSDKDKEFALREFFGTRVEIKRKGKGGQIIIDFFSDDELEGIVGKIK